MNKLDAQAARRAELRKHRELALRMIARDLHRLADDLLSLQDDAESSVATRLAELVGGLMRTLAEHPPEIDLATIASVVGDVFRATPEELCSRRRTQHLATARQVAIYLARELTDHSFPAISHYFRRDHSTAIHAHRQIAIRAGRDPQFQALLDKLKESMRTASLRPPIAALTLDAATA